MIVNGPVPESVFVEAATGARVSALSPAQTVTVVVPAP